MRKWDYFLVENSFIVRMDVQKSYAERLLPDGSWVEYPDLPDVTMNGRWIKTKAEALKLAKKIVREEKTIKKTRKRI